MAAHFRHRQAKRGQPAPGFYIHLGPGECWGGGGIYHPDQATLTRIRERMVSHVREWDEVRNSGIEIEGARLTRVPAGFDRTHRLAEDLKWKDLYTGTAFTQADATSDTFLDRYMDCCRRAASLVEFLTRAVGLPWQRP